MSHLVLNTKLSCSASVCKQVDKLQLAKISTLVTSQSPLTSVSFLICITTHDVKRWQQQNINNIFTHKLPVVS